VATTSAPAVATTSACAPWRGGPHPHPPTGVRTRPSKHATATSTAYDVLYNPRATSEQRGLRNRRRNSAAGAVDLRTARPSPVRWTGSHALLGSGRRRWRQHRGHRSQRDGAVARLASHLKELGARGMDPWLSPLSTFTRLVIILPRDAGGRRGKESRLHGHPVEVGDDGRLKDEAGRNV
jgi:hypothetical protein